MTLNEWIEKYKEEAKRLKCEWAYTGEPEDYKYWYEQGEDPKEMVWLDIESARD